MNHLTGRPCLIIPDFAMAMLSKVPPNAARCSSDIVVMIDKASPELDIIFVASRAPPKPACYIEKWRLDLSKIQFHLSTFVMEEDEKQKVTLDTSTFVCMYSKNQHQKVESYPTKHI